MPYAILRIFFIAIAAALAPASIALAGNDEAAGTPLESPPTDIGDCAALTSLAAKETCYAALAPELVAECESMHAFRCAPYRDMHFADTEMTQALEQLIAISETVYADYIHTDPAFIEDLVTNLGEADRTWRIWRDAECALDPYLDGMSRRDAGDLTEVCRVSHTHKRTVEIRARIQQLEASSE